MKVLSKEHAENFALAMGLKNKFDANDPIGMERRVSYIVKEIGSFFMLDNYDEIIGMDSIYDVAHNIVEPALTRCRDSYVFDDDGMAFFDKYGSGDEEIIYNIAEILKHPKDALDYVIENAYDMSTKYLLKRALKSYVPEEFELPVDKNNILECVPEKYAMMISKGKHATGDIEHLGGLYLADPGELVKTGRLTVGNVLANANTFYKCDPNLDWLGFHGYSTFVAFVYRYDSSRSANWSRYCS